MENLVLANTQQSALGQLENKNLLLESTPFERSHSDNPYKHTSNFFGDIMSDDFASLDNKRYKRANSLPKDDQMNSQLQQQKNLTEAIIEGNKPNSFLPYISAIEDKSKGGFTNNIQANDYYDWKQEQSTLNSFGQDDSSFRYSEQTQPSPVIPSNTDVLKRTRPEDDYSQNSYNPMNMNQTIFNVNALPPPSDPNDPTSKPRRQHVRYPGDMYTPQWVRFSGHLKEGYCDLCTPGKWLQLKNSAYWYHKQFFHGISSVSGKFFQAPLQSRLKDADIVEGLCHQCNSWVQVSSTKRRNSVLWFRHAHKCHVYHKPKSVYGKRR